MNTGKSIRGGFGSSHIKPRISTGEVLPAGKHKVVIIQVEKEMPEPNESFTRAEDEYQYKVLFKCVLGIISVWINSLGFIKPKEAGSITAAELPDDINYKAIGTTEKLFEKMPLAQKITTLCTSAGGYLVRKDNNLRLRSLKHTQEASSFAGQLYGAAGIPDDLEFEEDEIPTLLRGKALQIKVAEKSYEGDVKYKVTGFAALSAEDIAETVESIA